MTKSILAVLLGLMIAGPAHSMIVCDADLRIHCRGTDVDTGEKVLIEYMNFRLTRNGELLGKDCAEARGTGYDVFLDNGYHLRERQPGHDWLALNDQVVANLQCDASND